MSRSTLHLLDNISEGTLGMVGKVMNARRSDPQAVQRWHLSSDSTPRGDGHRHHHSWKRAFSYLLKTGARVGGPTPENPGGVLQTVATGPQSLEVKARGAKKKVVRSPGGEKRAGPKGTKMK